MMQIPLQDQATAHLNTMYGGRRAKKAAPVLESTFDILMEKLGYDTWYTYAEMHALTGVPVNTLFTFVKRMNGGKIESILETKREQIDGKGQWIELNIANAAIAAYANYKFADQADVLVNARLAADAVGATRMDRPEWCAVNPANGEIFDAHDGRPLLDSAAILQRAEAAGAATTFNNWGDAADIGVSVRALTAESSTHGSSRRRTLRPRHPLPLSGSRRTSSRCGCRMPSAPARWPSPRSELWGIDARHKTGEV
jgi:hypothetical protein